ncbi:MAG: radical SAM protein [Candidatus Scalindua sp.]
MNVCCIYSVDDYVSIEKPLHAFESLPFGLSYIASSLKHAGFDTKALVFTNDTNHVNVLRKYIQQYNPRLFCLTSVSSQYHLIVKIAKAIKLIDSLLTIILGGPHASLNPSTVILEESFDAICVSEGERAVVEYATQIKDKKTPSNIKNLWIRNRELKSIEKNGNEPFLQNLDLLPYIDREIWQDWIADKSRMVSMLIGRGCPYKCTYCSNHALAKLSDSKYVRFRSTENIIGEIEEIIKKFPDIRRIYFQAETISANLKYSFQLCDELREFNSTLKEPLKFGANLTIRRALAENDEFLLKLKSANFEFISIGLESGSERVRKEILRRPKYTNEDIINFCKIASKVGIDVNLFVLVGLPGETLTDFKETVKCTRACNPSHVHLSIFYPYPGTDLYDVTKEMNLLKEEVIDTQFERKKANLDLPGFPRMQIQKEFILFYYNVYKGKMPYYKIGSRILRELIYLSPSLNALYGKVSDLQFVRPILRRLSTFYK